MASRHVTGFIEATAQDKSLQAEWNAAETPEALVGLGKRHGYEFDVEELKTALDAVYRVQSGELGEEELDQAAGGISYPTLVRTKSSLQYYEGWPCKWLSSP